ncbi:4'-phosphopantetheinyl transferase superfamily protein [Verrucomicrobium sp. 3C]|uniref:4'-phosphopantetheinyl transferase family protein n=1 Tax=Verrucomicrobium sp. 3C TaxID=1134055 RepID=UPI00035C26C9|nr:4'-phosphopantetheinyl transferase superfamily protein [Verrucomicrobium sp. 3C]
MALPFPDPSTVHLFASRFSTLPVGGEEDVRPPGRPQALRSETVLRRLLAGYIGARPEEVPLQKNPWGKPLLPDSLGLWFNLSHSDDRWMAAVASFPVGIDLEARLPRKDPLRLAWRFLLPEEAWDVTCSPSGEQTTAFLRIWTKKEAFLKGCGMGLYRSPRSFRFARRNGSCWETVDPPEADGATWTVNSWLREDGSFCALAVSHPQPEKLVVSMEEFSPDA